MDNKYLTESQKDDILRNYRYSDTLHMVYSYAKNSSRPLRISVISEYFSEIETYLKELLLADNIDGQTEIENTYKVNQSFIEFFTPNNEAMIYGVSRDILVCFNVSYEIYRQLAVRTTGVEIRLPVFR